MPAQQLAGAIVASAALGASLWLLSRAVYHVGIAPLASALTTLLRGSPWPFYLWLLPGTILHELSHWLACRVLLVRVFEFVPFSPQPDGTLGWVSHEPVDPIRTSIVSLAPLAGGSAALYFASALLVPGLLEITTGGRGYVDPAEGLWAAPALALGALSRADYGAWRTWLFLYLAFSIGRALAPSASDLWQILGAAAVAGGLGFLFGVLDTWAGGGLSAHPLVESFARGLLPVIARLNVLLVFALASVSLGVVLLVPVGTLIGLASRRRPRAAGKKRRIRGGRA